MAQPTILDTSASCGSSESATAWLCSMASTQEAGL